MDPQNFRKVNLGLRGLYIIFLNETKAFFRNKGLFVSMTLQPILYFGFLVTGLSKTAGSVKFEGSVIPYSSYAIVGVMSLIMTSQMSQAIYRSTVDKQFGLLAIKFTNGIRPISYIIGMSTFPMLGYVYESIILFILGYATKALIPLPYFAVSILFGMVILLFWTSIGIMISVLLKNYQQRDVVTQLIFTPLAFTAPAFYLLSNAPSYIKPFAYLNPMTYQLFALRTISMGKISSLNLLCIVMLSIIFLVVAAIVLDKMTLTLQER